MMRFVHSKEWEARLCEAIVTEHMKPNIVKACLNIHIGGMPGSSSVEHLITLKTWMLMKEEKKLTGIFQAFVMEKFSKMNDELEDARAGCEKIETP